MKYNKRIVLGMILIATGFLLFLVMILSSIEANSIDIQYPRVFLWLLPILTCVISGSLIFISAWTSRTNENSGEHWICNIAPNKSELANQELSLEE